MRSILDTCTPHSDVLSGELRDDMCAVRLGDAIAGRADPIYQVAVRFFSNTYPTDGLRTPLKTALARVAGRPEGAPVIRLETTFGGGKTHNLIALQHLRSGGAFSLLQAANSPLHLNPPFSLEGAGSAVDAGPPARLLIQGPVVKGIGSFPS